MRRFVDDDDSYLEWLAAHPEGFVINTERSPRAAYVMLHRSSCRTIGATPTRGANGPTTTSRCAGIGTSSRNSQDSMWVAPRNHAHSASDRGARRHRMTRTTCPIGGMSARRRCRRLWASYRLVQGQPHEYAGEPTGDRVCVGGLGEAGSLEECAGAHVGHREVDLLSFVVHRITLDRRRTL
jgi:hypothetical protein